MTGADLNYIGSITIDEALMNAANNASRREIAGLLGVLNNDRIHTGHENNDLAKKVLEGVLKYIPAHFFGGETDRYRMSETIRLARGECYLWAVPNIDKMRKNDAHSRCLRT